MKNMLHQHPSPDVRRALLNLADALCSWERTTGRDNLLIVKDTVGCEYRSLSGAPVPDDIPDGHLIEGFESLKQEQPPTQ